MKLCEYLVAKLEADGYDGLCNGACGCSLDKGLCPCDAIENDCEPGYKGASPPWAGPDCTTFIWRTKELAAAANRGEFPEEES